MFWRARTCTYLLSLFTCLFNKEKEDIRTLARQFFNGERTHPYTASVWKNRVWVFHEETITPWLHPHPHPWIYVAAVDHKRRSPSWLKEIINNSSTESNPPYGTTTNHEGAITKWRAIIMETAAWLWIVIPSKKTDSPWFVTILNYQGKTQSMLNRYMLWSMCECRFVLTCSRAISLTTCRWSDSTQVQLGSSTTNSAPHSFWWRQWQTWCGIRTHEELTCQLIRRPGDLEAQSPS